MYPPQQNVSNDTPQGNSDYHKLIINDESREEQKSQAFQNDQNYNYPIIQQVQYPVNQPPYYQQPHQHQLQQNYQQSYQQQPYQQPFLQQQQLYNPQYNQIVPHHEQLNNQTDGQNSGQNKRFGVWVTSIWAIQSLIDYILVLYVGIYTIPYQFGIVCIFLMFLIPIIVFKFNENQSAVSVVLFFAFIIASIGSSRGLIYILDGYYQFFITFQYYQIGTMTVSFIYLLNTHKKPEFKQLMKLMTVVLTYCMINYFYVMGFMGLERFFIDLLLNILIWAICCSFLCHNLVNTLNGLYRIEQENIKEQHLDRIYIIQTLFFHFWNLMNLIYKIQIYYQLLKICHLQRYDVFKYV